jgi:hypothetical protein
MANTFPVWIDACRFTPINQQSSVTFLFPTMFELLLMQNFDSGAVSSLSWESE